MRIVAQQTNMGKTYLWWLRVISAHNKIGPCQFRPTNYVKLDFNAAKEIKCYWKYIKWENRVIVWKKNLKIN